MGISAEKLKLEEKKMGEKRGNSRTESFHNKNEKVIEWTLW